MICELLLIMTVQMPEQTQFFHHRYEIPDVVSSKRCDDLRENTKQKLLADLEMQALFSSLSGRQYFGSIEVQSVYTASPLERLLARVILGE